MTTYVFQLVSSHARGDVLDVSVKAPHVETEQYGAVPGLDLSASYDAEKGEGAIFLSTAVKPTLCPPI